MTTGDLEVLHRLLVGLTRVEERLEHTATGLAEVRAQLSALVERVDTRIATTDGRVRSLERQVRRRTKVAAALGSIAATLAAAWAKLKGGSS